MAWECRYGSEGKGRASLGPIRVRIFLFSLSGSINLYRVCIIMGEMNEEHEQGQIVGSGDSQTYVYLDI